MLALLHVVVQSYSLGSTLPARTRATRCSSARCLSEGQDYMLQELNPAKAGILCGPPSPPGHSPPWPPLPPLSPRPSPRSPRGVKWSRAAAERRMETKDVPQHERLGMIQVTSISEKRMEALSFLATPEEASLLADSSVGAASSKRKWGFGRVAGRPRTDNESSSLEKVGDEKVGAATFQ